MLINFSDNVNCPIFTTFKMLSQARLQSKKQSDLLGNDCFFILSMSILFFRISGNYSASSVAVFRKAKLSYIV